MQHIENLVRPISDFMAKQGVKSSGFTNNLQ